MPSVCVWTGATDGDVNNAGNWSGAVPITGDDIIFDSRGTKDLDTNMNALAAVHPANVRVAESFVKKIGASGSPLELDYITEELAYAGLGDEAWFEFKSGVNVTRVIVTNSGSGLNALHLDSHEGGMRLNALRGKIQIVAGATILTPILVGQISSINDVNLTIPASVSFDAPSEIIQTGGTITSASGNNTLKLRSIAGTMTLTGTALMGEFDGHGGTLNYQASGNIGKVYGYAGKFDASGSPGMTITDAELWALGTINIANGLWNIAVTNGVVMHGNGNLIIDPGRVLTPA